MATEVTCICDGCGLRVDIEDARDKRWFMVDYLWSTKVDWEQLRFLYCSLNCLVKGQTAGKKVLSDSVAARQA